MPYWDRSVPGGPLLVVPYALDSNDMKFFHPNGFVRARDMVEYVGDALETLRNEVWVARRSDIARAFQAQ